MPPFDLATRLRSLAHPGTFVHHGSLYVAKAIEPEFRAAESYLRGDRVMARTLDDLERGSQPVYVTGNDHDDDHFDAVTRTVAWDPYSALETSAGGTQSPALGFGHECVHADEPGPRRERLAHLWDVAYDNKEERRVIDGAETHAARTLGESTRRDHAGLPFRVASPTARVRLGPGLGS